jgi:hypothetical protein
MGSGYWSSDVYETAERLRGGKSAFSYSDSDARTVHPSLDPFDVGKRESRDSAEHPESLAIAVLFDVTGSMGAVPRALQKKLPKLLGLLKDGRYARDPQLMFGAIGDATCDRAPLQIGQFESDNRMDGDLEHILLEGGGGGQKTESYELAMYFMARHTSIDCLDKRGRRGYLFIIGDEMPYPAVKPREVSAWIGDELPQPVPVRNLVAQLTRRWDTYYILPVGTSYAGDGQVLGAWRGLLGQNVIELGDLDAVCETIALTVGLGEEAIDLAEGLADLHDVGSTAGSTVQRALAGIGAYHAGAGGRGDTPPGGGAAARGGAGGGGTAARGGAGGRGLRAVGAGLARRALPAPRPPQAGGSEAGGSASEGSGTGGSRPGGSAPGGSGAGRSGAAAVPPAGRGTGGAGASRDRSGDSGVDFPSGSVLL